MTELTTTLTLRAASIGSRSAVQALIGSEPITIPVTAAVSDSLQMTLPVTALAQLSQPFSVPLTITLEIAEGFAPAQVVLTRYERQIRGLDRADPALNGQLHPRGAFLWKDLTNREVPRDVVKPRDVPDDARNFVLLNNDDQVEILRREGEFYFVRVLTNLADRSAPSVLDQQGWIARRIVDGQP